MSPLKARPCRSGRPFDLFSPLCTLPSSGGAPSQARPVRAPPFWKNAPRGCQCDEQRCLARTARHATPAEKRNVVRFQALGAHLQADFRATPPAHGSTSFNKPQSRQLHKLYATQSCGRAKRRVGGGECPGNSRCGPVSDCCRLCSGTSMSNIDTDGCNSKPERP